MSAKTKSNKRASVSAQQVTTQKNSLQRFIPLVIISLYLLVDFVPEWGAVDLIGSQWLYLALINGIGIGYIGYYYKNHGYESVLKGLFGQFIPQVYLVLFVLAGVSILFAINPTEALVCYAYFTTTLLAFFSISILLSSNKNSFKTIAQLVVIILLIQSIHTLSNFLNGMNDTPLGDLVLSLKGNTGNKNIFAASLAIKLSFVMYCIYISKSWNRLIYISILVLGVVCLLLINARSAYLGLIIEVSLVLLFIILQFLKDKKVKEGLYLVGAILVPIIISFFIAQTLLSNGKQATSVPSGFSSITGRLESITSKTAVSNAGRLKLWTSGFDYIKKHPFMGSGYGNCKIAIVPYEHHFMTGFEFNQHLHNDFIESAFELGILGGLLFVSLFVGVLIGVIKVWKSKSDDQLKIMTVFSLIALAGYATDAFFNFPSERPIMQLLFSLILAMHAGALTLIQKEKNHLRGFKSKYTTPVIACISIMLVLFAGYYRYNTYQSLVAQSLTIPDFPNRATHSWKEINDKLPDIPNLDANNIPVDVVKAWYLSQDGKYSEALTLLNRSVQVNPYGLANELIKARIFLQTHQLDSALYYANKGFQTRPSNIGFYVILNDIYRQSRDTLSLTKTFRKCIQYLPTVGVWDSYISTLMALNYPSDRLLSIIQTAQKQFPNEKSIQEKGLLVKATLAMNASNIPLALSGFLKLAELNPTRYDYLENVGVCYFATKKYALALPYLDRVIAAKIYANGRAEYFKSLCLLNLGQKQEGCFYLKIASSRDYPGAIKLATTYCR